MYTEENIKLQKPLTDDEMLDAFCKEAPFRSYVEAYCAGIRFVERYHDASKTRDEA